MYVLPNCYKLQFKRERGSFIPGNLGTSNVLSHKNFNYQSILSSTSVVLLHLGLEDLWITFLLVIQFFLGSALRT